MLYKYIDETTIVPFQNVIIDNKGNVFTNDEALSLSKEYGYKELIEEDIPSFNSDYQELSYTYTDEENNILKTYKVKNKDIDLEEFRTEKISNLSKICEQKILEGCDVKLSDNQTYHFTLTAYDQTDIAAISLAVQSNKNMFNKIDENGNYLYSYHADGQNCKYYSGEDIMTIANECTLYINYMKTYYNSLRNYIKSFTKLEEIGETNWGTEIPIEFQSEPLKDLLEQMNNE